MEGVGKNSREKFESLGSKFSEFKFEIPGPLAPLVTPSCTPRPLPTGPHHWTSSLRKSYSFYLLFLFLFSCYITFHGFTKPKTPKETRESALVLPTPPSSGENIILKRFHSQGIPCNNTSSPYNRMKGPNEAHGEFLLTRHLLTYYCNLRVQIEFFADAAFINLLLQLESPD